MSAASVLEEKFRKLRNAVYQAIVNDNVSQLAETLSITPIDNEFKIFLGENMMNLAASEGSHEIVLYLLETRNANVDLRDTFGKTPLMKAAQYGRIEVFKCLLEHGADINATDVYGSTAMHYAARERSNAMHDEYREGQYKVINFVLDNNDRLSLNLNLQNSRGLTPFLFACRECCASIIERMIHYGANWDLRDSDGLAALPFGWTPLHWAARNQDPQVVEMFLNLGLDANAKDNRGYSPLHHVNSAENARLLIDHGANLDARNNDGRTPQESIGIHNVWYFLRLVRSFRETRQRWLLLFGLDRNETDQDETNQEEGGNNNQDTDENGASVKPFLLVKALHQLLCQQGNVDEQVRMGCVNVAFLGLRKNGPKAIEEHHGGDEKCSAETKRPSEGP